MALRFSRASTVGLILALALVFQGCAAPLHLAWEKDSKFESRPSRVVGESTTLSIRCTGVSDTQARLAAEIVSATHYEREVTSWNGRHLGLRGYPWTVAFISWIFAMGAADLHAEQVADTGADSETQGSQQGAVVFLAIFSSFLIT